MTSPSNAQLPILDPLDVIGTTRLPNARDLRERGITQPLPTPDPEVALRRAALELEQASLKVQQAIIDKQPESSLREIVTAHEYVPEEDEEESPLLTNEEKREAENAMIAKVSGKEVGEVEAVRAAAPVTIDMPEFVKKVRTVKKRAAKRAPAKRVGRPPKRLQAPAAVPSPSTMQPGSSIDLTVAQAALALTNSQTGSAVTMEDLKTVSEIDEDNADAYRWTVGGDDVRELTAAEAALILTNMQSGTDFTMRDLRTAREMVDLWDNEDVYPWVVGILP